MEWIELTGKTIDEARDEALERLGVDESEAEIEVIEHPSVSMFGRVKSLARIRARVAPVEAPPKATQRSPKRRERSKGSNDRSSRGGSNNNNNGKQASSSSASKASAQVEPMDAESVADSVGAFLGELAGRFGDDVSVDRTIDGDRVEVSVDGGGLGVLVGQGGRTADAVVELSKAVMLKEAKGGTDVRLSVDIAGYRAIRRTALENYARTIAAEVKESGTAASLESMGSIDRKIVHDAITDVDGVETESEGQGRDRRVVIKPAD